LPKQRSTLLKWAQWLAPALVGATASTWAVAQPASSPPARAAPTAQPAVSPSAARTNAPLLPKPNAAIKANAKAQIHDEDLLLLAVDLDGLTVTDALPAYGMAADPLLPIGELARLLDLNITVTPAQGQIIGTIGQAQRPLTIDIASDTARLNGKGIMFAPEDIAVTDAEIYIRTSALERFLPVTAKADAEGLLLKLHALEPLPIQARLERLARLRDLQPGVDGSNDETLKIQTPYSLISPPAFDIDGALGASVTAPRFVHSYDIRVANDFLFTGFQGYIGSDENGHISSARATFERHDVKGGLLGPLNATSASAGDVFTPGMAIGPRSQTGRGFEFSTAPLEQTSVFNRIDLRGELPVGYDVELYINDVLRSGQRTPTQGRYEFLNVPLVRGINVIRIVTNGPRGERTEETRIVNVGGGQLAKGKLNFEMGVVQQDASLFTVGKQDLIDAAATGSGTPATTDQLAPGVGKLRVTANLTYGLTEGVTVIAGAAMYPTPVAAGNGVIERELVTAGLRTSLFGAAVQLDAAADSNRGAALAVGLAAQPFGVSTLGRQVFYHGGFVDESIGAGSVDKPDVSHTEINMDFSVRPMKDMLLPLSVRGTLDVFADHSSQLTASFRASSTLKNVLLSGGFDLTQASTPGGRTIDSATGNLAASTFYQFKWQLRANLDYNISPRFSINDISVTADRDLTKNQSLRLGIGQAFSGGGTTFQVGDILHTRVGDLSLTGNYTAPLNQWQLGLTFATGLVFDPYSKRYVLTRPGPASGGNLAFQAFEDANGNGVYDEGDKPVEKITIDGGSTKGVTDAKGRVFVTGLGSGPTGRVQVGLDAIDDPYVQSPPHTVSFSPRPGRTVMVPYPLTATSEVIIHILLRREGRLLGLSAVRFRLVPKKGAALETSTEFDGSAGFEQIGAGTYQVQLDTEQAERLHMRIKDPVTVVVPATGGPLPDQNVEVIFDQPETAAPATTG